MSHQILNEAQRAAVRDAIAGALTGVYYCGRAWSAWGIGTMSQDDFTPAANVDEVLDALMDAAIEGVTQAASIQAAEKVPCSECKGSGGTSVHAAIHHGEHGCTDCNGKGFNWEPIESGLAAALARVTGNQGVGVPADLHVRAQGYADSIKHIAEKNFVSRSDKSQLLELAMRVRHLATPAPSGLVERIPEKRTAADPWLSVKDGLPACTVECISRDLKVSNTMFVHGTTADGSEGFGLADYQEDGKWHCYGGDYDFMHIVEVTHYMRADRHAQ